MAARGGSMQLGAHTVIEKKALKIRSRYLVDDSKQEPRVGGSNRSSSNSPADSGRPRSQLFQNLSIDLFHKAFPFFINP